MCPYGSRSPCRAKRDFPQGTSPSPSLTFDFKQKLRLWIFPTCKFSKVPSYICIFMIINVSLVIFIYVQYIYIICINMSYIYMSYMCVHILQLPRSCACAPWGWEEVHMGSSSSVPMPWNWYSAWLPNSAAAKRKPVFKTCPPDDSEGRLRVGNGGTPGCEAWLLQLATKMIKHWWFSGWMLINITYVEHVGHGNTNHGAGILT